MNSDCAETRIALIEAWFRAHEDGEFCEYPSDHMSVLTGDHFKARTIIYSTKSHCFSQLRGLDLESPVATIGRYGLPNSQDLALLSNHATSVNRVFIGDADPRIFWFFRGFASMCRFSGMASTMIFSFGMTIERSTEFKLLCRTANARRFKSYLNSAPTFESYLGKPVPRCSTMDSKLSWRV